MTFVRVRQAHRSTAERFWDWATSASISCLEASASMVKVTLMLLKPLRTSGRRRGSRGRRASPSTVASTERNWMPAVLRDRRHARGEAARQADEEVLDRRDARCPRRRDLGVVGVEDRLGFVLLLLAEAEEVLNLRSVLCDAVLPLRRMLAR